MTIDRHPVRFFVHKRPHVDFFLSVVGLGRNIRPSLTADPAQVSQWFELVVFTASMEIYGTAVADKLDGNQGMLNRSDTTLPSV